MALIKMIDRRRNNSGGYYEKGEVYDVAADTAAYFVAIGVAAYDYGLAPVGMMTVKQLPNQPWPGVRPNYDGPITLIGWDDPPAWPGGQYDQWVKIDQLYEPIAETFSMLPVGPVSADEFAQYWAAGYTAIEVAGHPLAADNRVLRFTSPDGTARSLIIWEKSKAEHDQDILCRVIRPIPSNLNQNAFGLVARAGNVATARAGYLLNVRSTSPAEITLTKFQSNASTTLATLPLSTALSNAIKAADAAVMLRLRAVGSAITGSIWMAGADESTAAVITATDSGVAIGQVGVSSASANYEGLLDYISVAYGGDVAPPPGA